MTDYQIEDDFLTDPTLKGWIKLAGTSLDWDTVDRIGGSLGTDPDARYAKFLGKAQTEADNILASFVVLGDNAPAFTLASLIGFFNSNEAAGQEECLAIKFKASLGGIVPQIYVAYDDGTKLESSSLTSLSFGSKYIISLIHSPEDKTASIHVYDFLTGTLLFEVSIEINTSKSFTLNQVGISEVSNNYGFTTDDWVYLVEALGEPEPVVYSTLYCTPEEARKMTNLDVVQDMSDEMLAQIERVYAMPQVDARFRSEGYAAPFSAGDNTPPLIKTVTALLTAAYACKKAYTGHAQNESPNYAALLEEVNEIWDSFLAGKMELIDITGVWIERTLDTSTDMLSTTEGTESTFTLDDIGGI